MNSGFYISEYMRDLGLAMLAEAVSRVTLPRAHAFSQTTAAIQAAAAAEILLMARLAQRDPALVFPGIPLGLTAQELADASSPLPLNDILRAIHDKQGYDIVDHERLSEFLALAKRLRHYHVQDIDLVSQVLRFAFVTMEPILSEFWGESLLPHIATLSTEDASRVGAWLEQLDIPYEDQN